MCGITGYIGKIYQVSDRILLNMRDTLSHRGPDDAGIFINGNKNIGLAHRRLSIIDITKSGHQPMIDHETQNCITFNGEIYNYKELRNELIQKGHIFSTKTDTEVLLKCYSAYGINMLEKLNGMFAFAIFDVKNNLMFFARDRFGIKPFYYGYSKNNDFIFASEIKAILAHPDFNNSIDFEAVVSYFKYRYIPSPQSIFQNTKKLKHGHYGIYNIESHQLTIHSYYNIYDKIINCPKSSLKKVNQNLQNAVKIRVLSSDVEVGTLLSGGIDSSIITYLAKQVNNNIQSFSIGFEPKEYSEINFANIVAEKLNTIHNKKIISDIDSNILDNIVHSYDEPLADSSIFPTYILCNEVSKKVKVTLSGDGGDEVFSGYNWYNTYLNDLQTHIKNLGFIKRISSNIKHIPNIEEYYNKLLLNRFNETSISNLLGENIKNNISDPPRRIFEEYCNKSFNSTRLVQLIDFNTFMIDDILTKVDRASMAHSLEIRVPYLDHNLIESVFNLPEKVYPFNSIKKPLLRKMFYDKIPEAIFNREKQGFSAPVMKWNMFKNINQQIIEGESVRDGILNKKYILNILNENPTNLQGMIWMIFLFEKWYQKWGK